MVGLIFWARGCDLVNGVVDGSEWRRDVNGFAVVINVHHDGAIVGSDSNVLIFFSDFHESGVAFRFQGVNGCVNRRELRLNLFAGVAADSPSERNAGRYQAPSPAP